MEWQDLGVRRLRWTESLLDTIRIEQYCTKSAIERTLNRDLKSQFQTLVYCLLDVPPSTSLSFPLCPNSHPLPFVLINSYPPFRTQPNSHSLSTDFSNILNPDSDYCFLSHRNLYFALKKKKSFLNKRNFILS